MTNATQALYEEHHASRREKGFSILKEDRARFVREQVGTGKRILDIGCRDGALTALFMESNSVLGVDIDAQALARAKEKGIEVRQMDVMGDWHELKGEAFDAIVAGELLEHVFHPEKLMGKARAHLKEGGVFVGSVPNAFSARNRLRYLAGSRRHTPLEDPTHITQFSARELAQMLSRSFSQVRLSGLGRMSALARWHPSLFAFDLVFAARA